ncbi:MAG: outer membrane protein [Flavobacteriales bacterium]
MCDVKFYLMKHILILASFIAFSCSAQSQDTWTLQRCIDFAFQHNIQIKQSQLSYDIAKINSLQAVGNALPNINASGSHGYNWGQTIDPFTNTFATERIQSNSFGLSSGVVLFNGFQTLNTIRQSKIDVESQKHLIEKMQNDIALSVANAYLNILFNQEFVSISISNLSGTQNQVNRVQTLLDVGQIPEGDLSEVMAQLAADEANLVSSENSLNLAYLSLTQMLQMSSDEGDNFQISTPSDDDLGDVSLIKDPSTAVSAALNNFPEIRSSETNVLSAERGLIIAKGGISPTISASYSYGTGYSGANQEGIGDPILSPTQIGIVDPTGEAVWSIFPQVSYSDFQTKAFGEQLSDNVNQSLFFSLRVPIFNGFSTYSNIERAKVNLLSAEYNLESSRQQLEQDVERAFADARAALGNYTASQKSVEASQKAFDYSKIRYEQGVINAVDYQNARIRLDNAKADLIRNKYDYVFKVKVIDFYLGKAITLR